MTKRTDFYADAFQFLTTDLVLGKEDKKKQFINQYIDFVSIDPNWERTFFTIAAVDVFKGGWDVVLNTHVEGTYNVKGSSDWEIKDVLTGIKICPAIPTPARAALDLLTLPDPRGWEIDKTRIYRQSVALVAEDNKAVDNLQRFFTAFHGLSDWITWNFADIRAEFYG